MNVKAILAGLAAMAILATPALGITLKKGTAVTLVFDQELNSRHTHVGDKVKFHVKDDISVGGHVVIRHGTRVWATVSDVHKNGRFGKNAQLKLDISPIRAMGMEIPLQPRQKGNMIGGSRGTKAAGAAGAGAILLGPLGLGAGYFVVGKAVNVHPGQQLETQVSETVHSR
ncbi:MAG TPA: hypothetical protein VG820_09135 [Fimbriimonadaceae bacterium]|nr:hypothetical protein [Fimbriimonadaceae bacterium]